MKMKQIFRNQNNDKDRCTENRSSCCMDEPTSAVEDRQLVEDIIRENAYHLWEQAGCPEGQADEFWFEAENSLKESWTE